MKTFVIQTSHDTNLSCLLMVKSSQLPCYESYTFRAVCISTFYVFLVDVLLNLN